MWSRLALHGQEKQASAARSILGHFSECLPAPDRHGSGGLLGGHCHAVGVNREDSRERYSSHMADDSQALGQEIRAWLWALGCYGGWMVSPDQVAQEKA